MISFLNGPLYGDKLMTANKYNNVYVYVYVCNNATKYMYIVTMVEVCEQDNKEKERKILIDSSKRVKLINAGDLLTATENVFLPLSIYTFKRNFFLFFRC